MKSTFTMIVTLAAMYLLNTACFSQNPDSLWKVYKNGGQADTIRLNAIQELVAHYRDLDFDSTITLAHEELKFSESVHPFEKTKKWRAKAYNTLGISFMYKGDYPKAMDNCTQALQLWQELKGKKGIASCYTNMGVIYEKQSDYPRAMEYNLKALQLSEEIADKKTMGLCYMNLGNLYNGQSNFTRALDYYFKSLNIAVEEGDKKNLGACYSNISIVYMNRSDYPKALEYCFKSLDMRKATGDKKGTIICYTCIGNIYAYQLEDSKAMDYFMKALQMAKEIGNQPSITECYVNIAEICNGMSDFKRAIKYCDSALTLSRQMGDVNAQLYTYNHLAAAYAGMGKYKEAYESHVKFKELTDSIFNVENSEQLNDLKTKFEVEKRESELKIKAEAAFKRKDLVVKSMSAIIVLLIILSLLVIRIQLLKRKKDKIIFEKEMDILESGKRQVENELKNAELTLNEYVQSMLEKNTLLERLKGDIEELKKLKSKELNELRLEDIEVLDKATILTDADWDKFKGLFERVYKGYFTRLKEKLPDLTQAEIRLVCLTKLNMNDKKMAGVLGISDATIRQTRYRLRKKYELQAEGSLEEIVNSI